MPTSITFTGSSSSASKLAYELLGPVTHYFLTQLDHHMRQMDNGDTRFLFVSRAGVRIRKLYEIFLAKTELVPPSGIETFWVSRLLLTKGIYGRSPIEAINAIGSELARYSLPDVMQFIFAAELQYGGMKLPSTWDQLPELSLREFVTLDSCDTSYLHEYLNSQSTMFEEYLSNIMGGMSRGVLIDSGWQGTGQCMLANHFQEYEWNGLYFGRQATNHPIASVVRANMVGLVFESDNYDPDRPETAITLHRHIIESLFEPNAPSVERLARINGRVWAPESTLIAEDPTDFKNDSHFHAVSHYLANNAGKIGPAEVLRRHYIAAKKLARMLTQPSREEAYALEGKHRSADYGRSTKVPVLLDPMDRNQWDSRAKRIQDSLWRQGQIALEYPPNQSAHFQMASLPHVAPSELVTPDMETSKGRVAIITRTKDRPVLFKRAAQSVARQTYLNYVWVVVNDGGDPEQVKSIIENSGVDPRCVILCSNSQSLGMEAASNIGIQASESEYVIIHDDDDSWAPEFLSTMIVFLESKDGSKYGGAISKTVYVSESIDNERVIEHGRSPYQDWVKTVHLSEMFNGNFFPPIAFLFRRNVYDTIGGFDETLPVLGDWDFNLRFLLEADIGVVSESLAYYHHRDVGKAASTYSNSVIGGASKHAEYNAIVRNRFIRAAATKGNVAGLLAAIGYATRDLRGRIDHAVATTKRTSRAPASSWVEQRLSQVFSQADDRWAILSFLAHNKTSTKKGFRRRHVIEHNQALADHIRELLMKGVQPARSEIAGWFKSGQLTLYPPPDFDETSYLQKNRDVAKSVESGRFASGFHHFYTYGCFEGRDRTNKL